MTSNNDRIQEVKKRRQELTQIIAAQEAALESQRDNEPFCKFCGSSRKKAERGPVYYRPCSCKEAQEEAEAFRHKWDELHNLRFELEACEIKIKSYAYRAVRLYENSGLGRRFRDRTFEAFQPTGYEKQFRKAYDFATGFETNQGNGLLFVGTVGTGKTHLAASIANYIIKELGIPVIVLNVTELFEKLRNFSETNNTLKELKKIPLLILDDIGKEKVTDWNREKLYEIINARYEDYLPVVITSNDTPANMERNLGGATYSRLCEMCELITMTGRDWRKQ
mgnify:CR=1 FL=1